MSTKTAVKVRGRRAQPPVPSPGFTPQGRIAFPQPVDHVPASRGDSVHNTLAAPGSGHDFSQIPVHPRTSTVGNQLIQPVAQSCPLALASPRACPFGGACHTCPVGVQPKLAINQSDDAYEREADRVADRPMRMPKPLSHVEPPISSKPVGPILQRKCAESEEVEELLQKKRSTSRGPTAFDRSSNVPPVVYEVLRSPGQPLDPATRAFMESRFGHDFSRVRVHTGAKAAASAQGVNALAYTVNRAVVFSNTRCAPGTAEGQRLLAHELTHVVQQERSSGVSSRSLGISAAGDAHEREAERVADIVTSGSYYLEWGLSPANSSVQRACGPAEVGVVRTCTGLTGDVLGDHFVFAGNCDTFQPGEDARLRLFAASVAPHDALEIHGFASEEGPAAFNESLSCLRAEKARLVLIGAGVSSSQIRTLFMHGATAGPRPARRSVVVERVPPVGPVPRPVPASPTPATTGAAVFGCSKGPAGQEAAIRSGISDALTTWLSAAINALSASPLHLDTVALLDKHFKTHAPEDVSLILDNFKKIQSNMDASSTKYECAEWDPRCLLGSAFTYAGSNTTHICSDVFDYPSIQMTRLVIHERGHGIGMRVDVYCDLHEAKYNTLSSKDAMNNADTYAFFAGEISGEFLC